MSDESVNDELSIEERIEQAIAAERETFKGELAGLNRKNTELSHELESKAREGQSVEERIKALEVDRIAAVKRADTVEAFAKVGLKDEWREATGISNPIEQAQRIKELIADAEAAAAERLSKEFNVDPEKHLDGSQRNFTAESLKGKSVDEINRLWGEGRVV